MGHRFAKLLLQIVMFGLLVLGVTLILYDGLKIGQGEFEEFVRELQPDNPPSRRREAALALGYRTPSHRTRSAINLLIKTLDDEHPGVQEAAVVALRGHESKASKAIPKLIAILSDPEIDDRGSAAYAIGGIAEPNGPYFDEVLVALDQAMDDPSPFARLDALAAMLELGQPFRIRPGLVELADFRSYRLRYRFRRMVARHWNTESPSFDAYLRAVGTTARNSGTRRFAAHYLLQRDRLDHVQAIYQSIVEDATPEQRPEILEEMVKLGLEPISATAPISADSASRKQ